MFRIQHISNLHLECYTKAVFPLIVKPNARYLALTGNIGVPHHKVFESFLDYVSSHWDHVFYVPSIKEYTTKSKISASHALLQETLQKRKNIHYFHYNNSMFTTAENVAILGGTLIPTEIPNARYWNNMMMNQWKEHIDYRKYLIRNGGSVFIVTNGKLDAPAQFKNRPVQAWIEGGAGNCLEFKIIKGHETTVDTELAKSAVMKYWE